MLGSCRTSTGLTAPCRVSQAASSPRVAATARVWQLKAPMAGPTGMPTACRRRRLLVAQAKHREGEQGASAVGHDLGWAHVARDVQARLAATAGGKQSLVDQLQAW